MLLIFYFHGVLKQLKLIIIQIFASKGFLVLWEYAWIPKLFCDAAFTWRPRELSCRLEKWLISTSSPDEVGLISENFAIWTVYEWEKVLIWRLWFPREVSSRFCSKTRWQMFLVGFRLPCWCLNGWAPGQHGFSIQISINLT